MNDGVNIGPQSVAGNLKLGFDGENVLGRAALAGDEPIANGGLPAADETAEGGLPAGFLDGQGKGPRGSDVLHNPDSSNGKPLGLQSEKASRPDEVNPLKCQHDKQAVCPFGGGVGRRGIEVKTITGERIQQRLDELKAKGEKPDSQAELARRCHLAQSTINGLVNGQSRSSAHLHVIARQLGVSTAWLAGVRAADDRGIEGEESAGATAEKLGFALVPEIDLSAYAGGGLSVLPVVAQVPVSRAWIHDWLGSRDKGLVYMTRGEGDDMAPTIQRGDLVTLDASATEIRGQDKLYCVTYGGAAIIRRVRRLADGSFELRADNPAVAPIVAQADELRSLAAVVAVLKRV